MKLKLHSVEIALAAMITICFAFAVQVASGDTITNALTAITGTATNDVIHNASATNVSAVLLFTTNAPGTALSEATGIDGRAGNDQITSTNAIEVNAESTLDISSGNYDYRGKEADAVSVGISGGPGQDTLTNTATLNSTAKANTDIGEIFSTVIFGVSGLPTEANAGAVGLEGGSDLDTLFNSGPITASANATSTVTKVRISSLDVPVDVFGFSDARNLADSVALGISAGTNSLPDAGQQTIRNDGALTVQAGADASSWQLVIELVGAARIDDSTTASSLAVGIGGDASDDVISHFGTMNVDAVSSAELDSAGLKMKGLMVKGMFDLFGADVGGINTTAEAQAAGMVGEAGNDILLNAQTNGIFDVHSRAESDSTTITLSISPPTGGGGAPPAQAATVLVPTSASPVTLATDNTNGPSGPTYGDADTRAWAVATGISGGEGNDTIDNRGWQKTFAEAYADSVGVAADVSISATNKNPIPGVAIAGAATSAQAEASGLAGDEGSDTLLNSGQLETTAYAEGNSTSVAVVLKGSTKGLNTGATVADSSSAAIANATGMAGGEGNDAITNTAAISASSTNKDGSTSVSVEVAGDKVGLAAGVALAKATTVSSGTAIGIDGGTGNDVINNAGSVNAIGYSESDSDSVGVTFNASLEGLAAGVTLTDSSSHATNIAAGVYDIGGDTVINSGAIGVSATARGDSDATSVTVAGGKVGMAFGVALSDASTTSHADAYGIDLGQEIGTNAFLGDTVLNTGSIAANAASTNSATAVSVGISAALQGVVGGVSAVKSDATADAAATAIRTGSGDDLVVSEGGGSLTANSAARGSSKSIAVTVSGAWEGTALGAALVDATTTANATAGGIETGDGRDTIINGTAITNNATADADSTSVATTFAGAWKGAAFGVSLADGTTRATADATGIDSGADDDTITNRATVATSATAAAASKSIAVTVAIAPKGISAGLAMARTGTESDASADGINGGEGNDTIENASLLDVNSTAKTKIKAIALNVAELGAGVVDASSAATSTAVGVDGGRGIDALRNDGTVDVTANSTIDATSAAANFAGYASGNVGMTNTAVAAGIQSASPTNAQTSGETILNGTNATVNVLAHAKTDSEGYVVQGGGAEFADVSAVANATATGLGGSQGGDTIFNDGTNRVTAWTEIDATSSSYQLVGVQLGTAGINATGVATGVEGGAGTNIIVNGATGFIAAEANVDTLAANLSANIGASIAVSGATADAVARGIRTGADADTIANSGSIDVTALSLGQAAAGSIGLFSLNLVDSLANATVEGINAGEGDDWIFNSGSITAGRVESGQTNLAKADSEAVSFDILAYSLASLGARVRATGIVGAGGDDTILNSGAIAVGDTNDWLAWGESFAFGGQIVGSANAYGGGSATVTASGIDGGAGLDTLVNASNGVITVNARSGAYAYSETYNLAGLFLPSTAESKADATVTATGIQGGAGADAVSNAGLVDSRAYAFAKADSDGEITFDVATWVYAESHANANATAIGVDLGSGSNYADNTGTINALATAQANAYAKSDTTFDSAESDVYSRPVATATGILAGDDDNTVLNATNGIITSTAIANTTDVQGNVSYANSDRGRDAMAIAGSEDHAPIAANATGIGTGTNADLILNDGQIVANARSDGIVTANSHVWYRHPRSDALAFVDATAKGIAAGVGQNLVVNNGQLTVTGWGNATNRAYSWSRDYTATANSAANVNAVATGIEADGVVTNTAGGTVDVTARATSYTEANTSAEHTYAIANLNALATGIATASGGGAPSPDRIVNEGALRVTAAAGENPNGTPLWSAFAKTYTHVTSVEADGCSTSVVHAVGISLGNRGATVINNGSMDVAGRGRAYAWADAHSELVHPTGIAIASSDALAQGILAGDGNNSLMNNGDLSVTAYADAFAHAYANDDVGSFRREEAHGTAYANSRAYGIQTGNGNNVITNNGTLAVTAISTANLWVDTEDNDDEYRTTKATGSAVGIQTGSGNDTIVNRGTITTTNQIGSQITSGIGIDAGAGNDTVALLDGSSVRGDIRLGTGDDTLQPVGTVQVAGTIDAGTGTDTLALNGAGRLDSSGGLFGFEQAIKTGAGTFILPQLAPLQWLGIEEGTLQLNSSYQFGSDSTFESYVNRDGSCGQFQVMGDAILAGNLAVVRGPGPFPIGTTSYDLILTTNRLTGVFAGTNLPPARPLLSFDLKYLPDRLQVEALGLSFATVANNRVERAVGGYLDRIVASSSGDLANVLDTFQQLSLPEFPEAFSSLSPDSYDDYTRATHDLVRQYSRSIQQRLDNLRLSTAAMTGRPSDAMLPGQNPVLLAYAGSTSDIGGLMAREQQEENRPNGIWASGFGQWSDQEARDGYTGYSFSPWGIAIGYDRAYSDAFTLGLSGAYASSHVSLDENRGNGDITSYSGAAYGSYFKNHLHFESVLSYGYHDYQNQRNLVIDSILRRAESKHDGQAFGGFASGGYIWQLKRWALEPFVSLQYAYLDESGFEESGADSVNLLVQDRQTQSLVSELGVRLAYMLKRERFTVVPELSLAWNHDFDIDDRVITASFAGSPNAAFSLPGQDVTPDGLSTGAAVTFLFGKGISTSLRYNGELREDNSAHMVSGELRFAF